MVDVGRVVVIIIIIVNKRMVRGRKEEAIISWKEGSKEKRVIHSGFWIMKNVKHANPDYGYCYR